MTACEAVSHDLTGSGFRHLETLGLTMTSGCGHARTNWYATTFLCEDGKPIVSIHADGAICAAVLDNGHMVNW